MAAHEAPEWVSWEAATSRLQLDDGELVIVEHGDELLMEEREGGIAFLGYRRRTVN